MGEVFYDLVQCSNHTHQIQVTPAKRKNNSRYVSGGQLSKHKQQRLFKYLINVEKSRSYTIVLIIYTHVYTFILELSISRISTCSSNFRSLYVV